MSTLLLAIPVGIGFYSAYNNMDSLKQIFDIEISQERQVINMALNFKKQVLTSISNLSHELKELTDRFKV